MAKEPSEQTEDVEHRIAAVIAELRAAGAYLRGAFFQQMERWVKDAVLARTSPWLRQAGAGGALPVLCPEDRPGMEGRGFKALSGGRNAGGRPGRVDSDAIRMRPMEAFMI